MAKVKIDPGQCGFTTCVHIQKKSGKVYEVRFESDCEMVRKLGEEMSELIFTDAFKKILDNPVYRKGSICLRHVSCPVPSGVLKALEVEAGLAVPKDVSIEFIKDDAD